MRCRHGHRLRARGFVLPGSLVRMDALLQQFTGTRGRVCRATGGRLEEHRNGKGTIGSAARRRGVILGRGLVVGMQEVGRAAGLGSGGLLTTWSTPLAKRPQVAIGSRPAPCTAMSERQCAVFLPWSRSTDVGARLPVFSSRPLAVCVSWAIIFPRMPRGSSLNGWQPRASSKEGKLTRTIWQRGGLPKRLPNGVRTCDFKCAS